ncbi:hypothetical protein [Microbacter margulisiae]|uniref:Uncharacterized protein n=1 Tax=Microbacter margulisiae TaxID=1350067 RepID=A0A7W5DR27_9PORP|nr:hypothetical protein [Microbacter margulisiae]MBB3187451.1 hypothetical protein [Microbacter margulisiae]
MSKVKELVPATGEYLNVCFIVNVAVTRPTAKAKTIESIYSMSCFCFDDT